MAITNKKPKEEIKAEIDEVLEETPPTTPNQPEVKVEDLLAKDPSALTAAEMDVLDEHKDDLTDEQKIAVGLLDAETIPSVETEVTPVVESSKPPEVVEPIKVEPIVIPPVVVPEVVEPTDDELNVYIKSQGTDPDELTNWEKIQAKKTMIAERKLEAIDKSNQTQREQSERAKQIDIFIDTTDGKPEFAKLSGHEEEFKRFAMGLSGDVEKVLLPAFLYNLPVVPPKRGSLFEHGGGGERPAKPKEGIDDADVVKNLRESNPREYARQLRAGKIKIEID